MSQRRITIVRCGPLWRASIEYVSSFGDWIPLGRWRHMLWEDPDGDWLANYYGFTRAHAITRARRAVARNANRRGDTRDVVEILTDTHGGEQQ